MSKYDVFLSHNSNDKALVEALATRLVDEAGISLFIDKWHLVPGEKWQEALEEALDNSASCAVFLGPYGLGNWESHEMRSALDSHVSGGQMRLIPVLLPGADAKDVTTLPRFIRHLTWVDFSGGIESNEGFRRLVAAIKGEVPGRQSLPELRCVSLTPSRPQHKLVGRQAMLADIKNRLFEYENIALNGLPGVGKSAMAIELANDPDVLDFFQHNVLWASLGHTPDVFSLLGDWADALKIPSNVVADLATIEARMKAINTALGSRPFLIVIDDALSTESAFDFRIGNKNCAHLLTTNNLQVALAFASCQIETVKELTIEDGLSLLKQFVPEVVLNEAPGVRELIKLVGGLPLALVLIGNHLKVKTRGRPRSLLKMELEKLLKESRDRLSLTYQEGRLSPRQSLDAVIGMSIEALSASESAALTRLCLFPSKPSTFSEDAAIAVSGASPEVIYALIDCGLLEFIEPDRCTINKIIIDYVSLTSGVETDLEAQCNMAQYYVSQLEQGALNTVQLELDHSNIVKCLGFAQSNNLSELLIKGVNLFFPSLERQGLFELAENLLKQAMSASEICNEVSDLIALRINLGSIAFYRDRYEEAESLYLEGLEQAKKNCDELSICKLCLGLGKVSFVLSRFGKDSNYFLEALHVARNTGQINIILDILASLGEMEDIRGNYDKAEKYFKEGLDLVSREGNEERYCSLLLHLGWVIAHLGEFARAEKVWQEGMELAQKLGHRGNLAFSHSVLGWVADRCGRYLEAEQHFNTGIKIAQEIGYLHVISILLTNLGAARIHRGDYASARQALSDGLEIVLKSGHDERRAILLENLGIIECRLGNFDKAEAYFKEGMELANTGIKERISALYTFLGEVAFQRKDLPLATEHLKKALELAGEINNPERTALANRMMSLLCCANIKYDDALKFLNEALNQARSLNYSWLISCVHNDLGLVALTNKSREARRHFDTAMEVARDIDSQDMIATALYGYSFCAAEEGDTVDALRFAEESQSIFGKIGHHKAGDVRVWINSINLQG